MAEIAPDRQKRNRQGIKLNSEEIWSPLTATVEKATNRRVGWRSSDEDTWLLPSIHADAE